MAEAIRPDICVIGAGSGGLSVAAGAVQMGASVVLVERARMGGDCLNYGCVPSKSLIAAAAAAEAVRQAGRYGIGTTAPQIDMVRVRDHVRGVIAAIEPHDSVERFTSLGVRVILAEGRFADRKTLIAGGQPVQAKFFVIATGSSPAMPPIDGLAGTPFLTNETIFDLDRVPDHLIVVGGGPIGAELAQAHRRLGAQVTMVVRSGLLPKDDPDLRTVVARRFQEEGIVVRQQTEIARVDHDAAGFTVTVAGSDGERVLRGSHLLVAVGRRPNLDGLDPAAAGVGVTGRGVTVDARLRTTNRRIFAIGDVTGRHLFTHAASDDAGIVIRNALFRLPAKSSEQVPWVTYTDPELAQVGATEAEARSRRGKDIRVLRWHFQENDRAQTERETGGLIKVVTTGRGRILGAGIVGRHAGELLLPWILALKSGQKVGAMASLIAPYPTLGEVSKRAAGSYYTPALFSERTRRLVRLLLKLP